MLERMIIARSLLVGNVQTHRFKAVSPVFWQGFDEGVLVNLEYTLRTLGVKFRQRKARISPKSLHCVDNGLIHRLKLFSRVLSMFLVRQPQVNCFHEHSVSLELYLEINGENHSKIAGNGLTHRLKPFLPIRVHLAAGSTAAKIGYASTCYN